MEEDGQVDTWAKYEKRPREQLIAACVAMDEALARVRELCAAADGEQLDDGWLWPSQVLDAIAGRRWVEGDDRPQDNANAGLTP